MEAREDAQFLARGVGREKVRNWSNDTSICPRIYIT